MKKFFIVFIALFMLSSFTFKLENSGHFAIKYEILKVDGMNYMVLYNKWTYSRSGVSTAVAVVNITKDRLEIEKTKLEIEYLKKQLNKK